MKGVKITLDLYEQIRYLYTVDGLSQRAIANKLKISRNTVSKYCKGNNVPWERKPYNTRTAPVVTDDVKQFIMNCLKEDEAHNIRKQKHTATRIFHRLKDELAFTGSESNIRKVVSGLREKQSTAFVPLEFSPGEAAQIDFGTAYVYINNHKKAIKFFCMRLCFSGYFFVKAYYSENEEAFLDAHVSAFEFFNGVPKRIIFDNAKVAVKEGLGAYVKQENERYKQLKAHYLFNTSYCNPRSGHEKGLVENLVGYVRRNTLVPMPRLTTLDELNDMLLSSCEKYLTHSIKGRQGTVGANYILEKGALHKLPEYPYQPDKAYYTETNSYSLITFKTNRYSVPTMFASKEVLVKISATDINIYHSNTLIATHERCYGKHKKIYNIEHYIDLIESKPRSIFNAAPVRQYVPAEVLSEFAKRSNGDRELLVYLKQNIPRKAQEAAISVIPTSLEKYDELIKEACR